MHFSTRGPTLSTYFHPQRSLSNETLKRLEGFFYFRVTISVNNAWLCGGVARGLWSAEMHSWVKLYIIITAGVVASDGANMATTFLFLPCLILELVKCYGMELKTGQGSPEPQWKKKSFKKNLYLRHSADAPLIQSDF